MASCVACGCTNRPQRKISGITFHRFPTDALKRNMWVKNIRRKDWMPSKYSRLCSQHFKESDFDRTSLCCVRLWPHAIPTVFGDFQSHLQEEKIPPANHLVEMDTNHQFSHQLVSISDDCKSCDNCDSMDMDITDNMAVNNVFSTEDVYEKKMEEIHINEIEEAYTSEMEEVYKNEMEKVNNINIKLQKKIKYLQQQKRRQKRKLEDMMRVYPELKETN